MYTKDLTSLLQLLSVSDQSGVLHVEPPEIAGEVWRGYLTLVAGNVMACQVRQVEDGRILLDGPEALRWLIGLGGLSWRLDEGHEAPQPATVVPPPAQSLRPGQSGTDVPDTHPGGPGDSAQRVADAIRQQGQAARPNPLPGCPQRTGRGEMEGVSALILREQRAVFQLVDGRRTAEEIARLLRKSAAEVRGVLDDLFRQGRIE